MAVYSKTLYELRQSIARTLDDNITGTAESGSSNTDLICSYLLRGNDYYNGWDCHIYDGTNEGETREVIDGWNANTTIQVSPAFTSALATNSKFELHKKYTTAQYNDAVNRAIEVGKDEYLLDKKTETATFATNTYEYAVPSGYRYISQIYWEDTTDANTYYVGNLIDSNKWWIVPVNATNSVIKFDNRRFPIGSDLNAQKMRIIGQQLQSNLTNDDDTCTMPSEYVIQMARAILLGQTADKQKEAEMAYKMAMTERQRMIVPPQGKSVFEV